jgi:hypothetical protein
VYIWNFWHYFLLVKTCQFKKLYTLYISVLAWQELNRYWKVLWSWSAFFDSHPELLTSLLLFYMHIFNQMSLFMFRHISELSLQGLTFFPKGHWSRTSEHQEFTGPEKFSTGPEYRNEGNKICWTQNLLVTEWHTGYII